MNNQQDLLRILNEKKALFIILLLLSAIVWIYSNGPDDGGWYLQASLKSAKGLMPYRDYMFPQGPLMVYLFTPAALSDYHIFAGRILAAFFSIAGLFAFGLSINKVNKEALPLFILGLICFPFGISYLTLIKTHAPTLLFIGIGLYAWVSEKNVLAAIFMAIAASLRLSMFPLYVLFVTWQLYNKNFKVLLSLVVPVLWFALWFYLSSGKIVEQMFLPFGFIRVNELTDVFSAMKGHIGLSEMLWRKPLTIFRCLSSFPLLLILFSFSGKKNNIWKKSTIGALVLMVVNLLAERPYEEYQLIPIYLLLFSACIRVDFSNKFRISGFVKIILLLAILIPWFRVFSWVRKSNYKPYLYQLKQQTAWMNENLPKGKFYPLDSYLSITIRRELLESAWLGQFSFLSKASDKFIQKFKLQNTNSLDNLLENGSLKSIYIPDLSMGKVYILKLLQMKADSYREVPLPKYFPKSACLYTFKKHLSVYSN